MWKEWSDNVSSQDPISKMELWREGGGGLEKGDGSGPTPDT